MGQRSYIVGIGAEELVTIRWKTAYSAKRAMWDFAYVHLGAEKK